MLFRKLIPPVPPPTQHATRIQKGRPHNTPTQSSKPQLHSTPIQHSKPQPHSIPNQPPKTTPPPAPSPNIFHNNQTLTIHWNTYAPAPSANHHSSKRSSPSIGISQATTHLLYHIPFRPTHKIHTGITYQTSSTLFPQSFHTHHQRKPKLTHHLKSNNQITKTTLSNTTQPRQSQTQPSSLQFTSQR